MDFGLNSAEKMIQNEWRRFCKKELNKEYVQWMDENVDFIPEELWQKFVDIGFFKTVIPEEYGGEPVSTMEAMIMCEEMCKASVSVSLAVGATAGLGTPFIRELASKEIKDKLLPLVGEGKLRSCMALTEPGGGTDILGAMVTFAEEKEDRWVINGEKIFITGAHVSDYMIVICKTEEDARPSESLSIFLVPSDSKGVSFSKVPKISCHHCDSVGISFNNVEIPKENLLGTQGRGWYEMLVVLNPERIAVAMMGVGIMAAVYDEAFAYVKQRQAFGGQIGRFQILQHHLADIKLNLENSRNLAYKAAWLCDNNKPYHMEAIMAKVIAAEGALHAGTHGAEIMGGYGICSEFPMQRYLRDALQIQFSPLSNEMCRNMMMQFEGLPKSWA